MRRMPFQPCQQQNCPNCQQNPFQNLPLTFAPTPQQPITGCNQCSSPVVTNKNCNPCSRPVLANLVNDQILNKVMSNPLVQAIMKNYRYQNPVQNVPSNIKPQVINNYFIIPSELLLKETKKVEEKNAAVKLKQQTKIQNGRRNDPYQATRPNQASQWKPQCIVPERQENLRFYNPTAQPYKPKVQTMPESTVPLEQKKKARVQNTQEKPVCKKNKKVSTDKTNQGAKIGINKETTIPIQKYKDAVKDFFDEYFENEEMNKPQIKRSGKDEQARSIKTEFEHQTIDKEPPLARQANRRRKPNKKTKNNERPPYFAQMVAHEIIRSSAEDEKLTDLSNQSQTIPETKVSLEQKRKARVQNPQKKTVCKKKNKVSTDKTNQCTEISINEETKIPIQKCEDTVKDFFDEYYENEEMNKPHTKRSGKDEQTRSFKTEFEHKTIDQETPPPRKANRRRKPYKTTKNNERPLYSTQMVAHENVKSSAEDEKPTDLSNQTQTIPETTIPLEQKRKARVQNPQEKPVCKKNNEISTNKTNQSAKIDINDETEIPIQKYKDAVKDFFDEYDENEEMNEPQTKISAEDELTRFIKTEFEHTTIEQEPPPPRQANLRRKPIKTTKNNERPPYFTQMVAQENEKSSAENERPTDLSNQSQTIPETTVPLEQKRKARVQNPQEKPVCKNNEVSTNKTNQSAKIDINEETEIPIQKYKDAVKDFFDEYYENEEMNEPQTKRSGEDELTRFFKTEFEHTTIDQEPPPPRQANLRRKPNKTTKNNEHPPYSTQIVAHENVKSSAKNEKPTDLSNQSQKDYIGEPVDFVNAKQLPKESRKARNPDDAIIRNVKSKYPGMSEKLVRELLFQIKQQLQNNQPQRQNNHHNNPYNNFYPLNYNPYHQRPYYPWFPVPKWAGIGNATANNIPRHPGRKQKSRQNKNPNQTKIQNDSANDIINDASKPKTVTEQTTEKTENETHIATTEKSNTDETTLETPQDTYTPVTEKKTNDPENTTPYSSSYEENAYPDSRLRQLGAEDNVPSIDDNGIGWVNDYYPDFSKDSFFDDEFYESHPEYYEEEIQRNERKIPSDKDINTRREMLRKYSKRRFNGISVFNENSLNKEEYITKSSPDFGSKSGEIVFKTPPGLEAPDFKTTKVKEYRDSEYLRPRYFSEDYDFNDHENISNDKKSPAAEIKSSTYSYFKIPYDSSSVKPSNVIGKDKTKTEIETDFANSKIVRYGNVPDFRSNEVTTQYLSSISQEEDIRNKYHYATDSDGTSIVMATSYFS